MKQEIKKAVESVFLECNESTRNLVKDALGLDELTKKTLTKKLNDESYFLATIQAFINLERSHKEEITELETKVKKASTKKAEKNDLEKLTSSAIGIGLLSVYGIKDKGYTNLELGVANYICRQALNPEQQTNAVDNLRQFSGRALTVLQGIEWLNSVNINYDILSQLIDFVDIDNDISNGKFTDAARDKINEKIKELNFEITLKEDKITAPKEADK